MNEKINNHLLNKCRETKLKITLCDVEILQKDKIYNTPGVIIDDVLTIMFSGGQSQSFKASELPVNFTLSNFETTEI